MTSTSVSKRSISKSFGRIFDSPSTENNETSGVSQTSKKTSSDSGKNSPSLNEKNVNEAPQSKQEKARWQRILKTYGITQEQYGELDAGHCRICLRDWSPTVRPCVDHDHKTGLVRGVICLYCNHRIVGRHRDGDMLQRVADYLRAPSTGWIVPPKPKKKRTRKKKI